MTTSADNPQPLGGNAMPRFGGIATFMRLPGNQATHDLDVAVVGVPFDIGTSNRPGARFGPRGIRAESVLLLRIDETHTPIRSALRKIGLLIEAQERKGSAP